MIKSLVEQYAEYFEISNLINMRNFPQGVKTSFSWSTYGNSVCLAMNKKYFHQAMNNKNIIAVITTPNVLKYDTLIQNKTVIVAGKADELFYFIHNAKIHSHDLETKFDNNDIASSASVSPTASLGRNVYIGDNAVIHHGCLVCDNTVIKRNTVLHPYVTVGTDGFFSKYVMGTKVHIKHYGGVQIGANCIIHTGTNVSRSVNYGENTELGDNVHIGIHSNVGHDCKVGSDSDLSAKVLLSGRVQIGKNCWVGAGATVSNAISIGDNARVNIGSVVLEDVPIGSTVSGNFAIEHRQHLRMHLKSKR